MDEEERFLETIEEEEDEIGIEPADRHLRRHQRLERKNSQAIGCFMSSGRRINAVALLPRYYGELLTWALHRHLEKEGWKVIQTLGYRGSEPVYIDVSTDHDRNENLLMNGQMLVKRGNSRFIITVDINLRWRNSVQVEGPAKRGNEVTEFVTGIMTIAQEQNFYRGKKIEFAGSLRFLNLDSRSWESVILDDSIKREIKANTSSFLSRGELWSKFGIPLKRGVLLAGEPGTGKTIICKALMAEAKGVTCITTSAYALDDDDYITELYELAQDLSPCLVFIEDVDFIGQNRAEFGYQKGPALMSLLAVLDGIEEKKEIVTIATTNCLETLDKALAQRPARFDRVIKLTRPGLEQRRELVDRLCERIPLEESIRDYIARHSEGCTPAQLQEIIFSLAIEHGEPVTCGESLSISTDVIDRVMSRINGKSKAGLGFRSCNNGHKPASALATNQTKEHWVKEGDQHNSEAQT